jgi:phage/plasmid-associated DNA primase
VVTLTIDPAVLAAIADKGYCWVAAHNEDAEVLRRHGFPGLAVPDVAALTAEVLARISALTVVMRPGLDGSIFGHQVKRRVVELGWRGWLTRSPLPEEWPDLATAERFEADHIAEALMSVAVSGLREQLDGAETTTAKHPGRPRAPAASKVAVTLAELLRPTLAFDGSRRRWMAYEAKHAGIWGELADEEVSERLRAALTTLLPEGFSWTLLQGVERLLRGMLRRIFTPPSRDWLPLRNGALHLPTKTLLRHTAERGFTWVLPFAYDEAATYTPIENWLLEAQDREQGRADVLVAYLRAILFGRTDLQRFIECIGPGGTGKGTYQRLAIAFVGLENTHITELRELEGNRFETSHIVDKRLVVITDADRYGGPVTRLKALTGDDPVRSERKYDPDARNLTPDAMVLVAANEQVQSTDYTSGLERRRLSIPFRHKPAQARQLIAFRRGAAVGEFVPYLAGLLNRVLAMTDAQMENLLRRTTQAVPALQEAHIRALVEANPLAQWADERLISDATALGYIGLAERDPLTGRIERQQDRLYANYRAYAEAAGDRRPVSVVRFRALLEDLCQHQLGLTDVTSGRDAEGTHLTAVRLRTDIDRVKPGFIRQAIASQPQESRTPPDATDTPPPRSPENAENVESIPAGGLGNAEFVEFVGFSKTSREENIENNFIERESDNPANSTQLFIPKGLDPTRPPANPTNSAEARKNGRPPRSKERGGWTWPTR